MASNQRLDELVQAITRRIAGGTPQATQHHSTTDARQVIKWSFFTTVVWGLCLQNYSSQSDIWLRNKVVDDLHCKNICARVCRRMWGCICANMGVCLSVFICVRVRARVCVWLRVRAQACARDDACMYACGGHVGAHTVALAGAGPRTCGCRPTCVRACAFVVVVVVVVVVVDICYLQHNIS